MSTTSITPSALSQLTGTQASSTATASTTAASTGNPDFNRFLTLLTAQLKYQDPMSPTDPTAFVAQLAQFSQVEQQTKTNTLLQQMAAALSGNSLSQSASLIGKQVSASVDTVAVPASGSASAVNLNVTQAALKNTRLVVTDGSGKALRSIPVGTGQTSVAFDGLLPNGQRLPAGSYGVKLVGDDTSGAEQTAGTIAAQGSVSEVRSQTGGGTMLILSNGSQVDASKVTSLAN